MVNVVERTSEPIGSEIIDVAAALPVKTLALVSTGGAMSVTIALERASELLTKAHTLQQVIEVRAIATAAHDYARQRKLGRHIIQQARAVTFEAVRKLGGMLTEMAKAAGGRPYHAVTGTLKVPVQTLSDLGISKNESSRAQQLFQLPEEVFRAIRDGRISFFGALAAIKRDREIRENFDEIKRERERRIADIELHVASCVDLFGLGIVPDLVITEPPMDALGEVAAACSAVPFVVLRVPQRPLPTVLDVVGKVLTYRGVTTSGGTQFSPAEKVLVLFCSDAAIAHFKTRLPPGHRKRPWSDTSPSAWRNALVWQFSLEGDLVCDPLLNVKNALAAVTQGRCFVGASLDPETVSTARERLSRVEPFRA